MLISFLFFSFHPHITLIITPCSSHIIDGMVPHTHTQTHTHAQSVTLGVLAIAILQSRSSPPQACQVIH